MVGCVLFGCCYCVVVVLFGSLSRVWYVVLFLLSILFGLSCLVVLSCVVRLSRLVVSVCGCVFLVLLFSLVCGVLAWSARVCVDVVPCLFVGFLVWWFSLVVWFLVVVFVFGCCPCLVGLVVVRVWCCVYLVCVFGWFLGWLVFVCCCFFLFGGSYCLVSLLVWLFILVACYLVWLFVNVRRFVIVLGCVPRVWVLSCLFVFIAWLFFNGWFVIVGFRVWLVRCLVVFLCGRFVLFWCFPCLVGLLAFGWISCVVGLFLFGGFLVWLVFLVGWCSWLDVLWFVFL